MYANKERSFESKKQVPATHGERMHLYRNGKDYSWRRGDTFVDSPKQFSN